MAKKDWSGKGIEVNCIIELMGAPKEHLEKTIRDFVSSLKKRDYLTVTRSYYAEPKPKDKLFTMYVELRMWIKGIPELFGFCIEAMPSSIEIIEPLEYKIGARDFTELLNDLLAKLHTVDKRLKNFTAQQKMLERNSSVLASNLIGLGLKEGPKNIGELRKLTGIPKENLTVLLDSLIKDNRLRKDGELYFLNN